MENLTNDTLFLTNSRLLFASHLSSGCRGLQQETPKPRDEIFSRVHSFLIGSNRLALEAAATTARALGFVPHLLSTPLSGDTTETARSFASTLRSLLIINQAPTCVLAGGETTVHITGAGKGGRNQEFALVVAEELQGENGWALLSAGTDGIDGPTDAAGAFVDGNTVKRAQQQGLEPLVFLKENDSYSFFSVLGDLFSPGPTGTNVMDIKIALFWPTTFWSTFPLELLRESRDIIKKRTMAKNYTTDTAGRVPPGQHLVEKWPVLSYGPTPRFNPAVWDLRLFGLVERPVRLNYQQFRALPQSRLVTDFHCVTTWSGLDNMWEGVLVRDIAALVQIKPETAMSSSTARGNTLDEPDARAISDTDVIFAYRHDGRDLEPDHGWPLRLVVPKLYAWKSAKWVGIEFLAEDKRGFWEVRGYHNRGNPWKEERYSDQEDDER